MHFFAQKLSQSILAFRNIIHRKRRPSSAIAARNFTSERNVTNRATIPHFTLSRTEGPRELISLIHVPLWCATRTTRFSAFYRVSHKKRTALASFYRTSPEPTTLIVRPREEHLSVRARTHTLGRAHVRPCARSKSFNAVVLSRLIKFPSILRISPMQLNRNSRLRDGGRGPTIRQAGEEEKSTQRKERSPRK